MKPIFTLASARSGTLYLRDLFQQNAPDCVCRHEPFFDWGNPTLFGPAIYDAYAGRVDRIRDRLIKKRNYLRRQNGRFYLESSHAFLKSSYRAALDVFPDLQLIHLVRDPLLVAKSEAYRQAWRERMHAPFHFYEGDDGRRHFCWALTGNEEIFQSLAGTSLNLFQWYFVQWIEIENRAMRFLSEHDLRDRCITLHSSRDLNDAEKIRAMLKHFDLPVPHPHVVLGGRKNKSVGHRTIITAEDEQQCEDVLDQLPPRYLEIFQRPPYCEFAWSARLRRHEQTRELSHAK